MYRPRGRKAAVSGDDIAKAVQDLLMDSQQGGEGGRDLLEIKGDLETAMEGVVQGQKALAKVLELSVIVARQYGWLTDGVEAVDTKLDETYTAINDIYGGVERAWNEFKAAGGKSYRSATRPGRPGSSRQNSRRSKSLRVSTKTRRYMGV